MKVRILILAIAVAASFSTGNRLSLCIREDGVDLRPVDHHCHDRDGRSHHDHSHEGCGHCDHHSSGMGSHAESCCFDLPADGTVARVLPPSLAVSVSLMLHSALSPIFVDRVESPDRPLRDLVLSTGPPHMLACLSSVILRT